ncbi:hypothetical protein B296_00019097 [Ensete ventricosum]|uniref:Uncharacterized protein n=1 Tax=Ensete ventricosum TaxID=4639 RepID=A0A427B0V7_ENSVE|nr:hypothetical protein B296_00019097 [Ensete ventricosum]
MESRGWLTNCATVTLGVPDLISVVGHPPSIAKNVVRFDVVAEESARLGSARVRKLLRISQEEVEKFERGQLDLLGSASRASHSRDLSRDLAQRPCQAAKRQHLSTELTIRHSYASLLIGNKNSGDETRALLLWTER